MPVSRAELAHPLSAALVHAGLSLGLPLEPDKNASPEMPPGVGSTPTNTLAGYRWSTARAYLENAPGELEVRGGHQVVRIVFRHGRAVGVRVIHAGQVMTVYAGLIVLSAGALASPHLLMLSGIGPANVLHGREIPVIRDSPAVGTRLDDHANIDVRFSVPRPLLDYPVTAPVGVSVHASSGLPDSVDGDLEVLSLLRPLGRMLGTDLADEHMSLLVSPLRRSARGTLELDPIDVTAPPHLRFHYAETAPERAGLRAAVRLAAELLDTVPLREVGARAEDPRLTLLDDHELDEWVRAHLLTALHTCATTPMGTAPETSVVDGRGAVHGVTGLHIADVGILPRTPTGGPAATAVLIGEVIADALTSARGDRAGSTASTS
jgi:choline dehydrogenase-like flavoprotein